MRNAHIFWAGVVLFIGLIMLGATSAVAASTAQLQQRILNLEKQLTQLKTQISQLEASLQQIKSIVAQQSSVHKGTFSQPVSSDVLGKEWDEIESGIPGVWTRRGSSTTWDARWSNGAAAVLQISITNTRTNVYGETIYDIKVVRNDLAGSPKGFSAVYTGVLKSTHELLDRAPKSIEGTMVYNWPEKGLYNKSQLWKATISHW